VKLYRPQDYSPVDHQDTISTGLATPSRGAEQVFVARQSTRAHGMGPLHRHNLEEVTILLEGEAHVQVGEETVSMQKGDVLIVPPNTLHQMRSAGGPIEYLIVSRAGATHSLADGDIRTPPWTK
jgi:quercetin dioxygenase-like cupin family protein